MLSTASVLFFHIKPHKEIVIGAAVYLLQFDQNTGADVQLTKFVFLIGSAADVASPALQFRTDFLLGKPSLKAEPPQVAAHIPILPDLLFHRLTYSKVFDQYWLHMLLFYAKIWPDIDRYIGQS